MAVVIQINELTSNGQSDTVIGSFSVAAIPTVGSAVRYHKDKSGPFTTGVVKQIVYNALDPADPSDPIMIVVVDARPSKAEPIEG